MFRSCLDTEFCRRIHVPKSNKVRVPCLGSSSVTRDVVLTSLLAKIPSRSPNTNATLSLMTAFLDLPHKAWNVYAVAAHVSRWVCWCAPVFVLCFPCAFCFVSCSSRHVFPFPFSVFGGIADAMRTFRQKRWWSMGVRRHICGDGHHLESLTRGSSRCHVQTGGHMLAGDAGPSRAVPRPCGEPGKSIVHRTE